MISIVHPCYRWNDWPVLVNSLFLWRAQEERELWASASKNDWQNVPTRLKCRALAWICDAVAESEAMRNQLQEHVDQVTARSDRKGTTGLDLFSAMLTQTGQIAHLSGPALQKEIQTRWQTSLSDAQRLEWDEKAKEQKKAEKMALETDAANFSAKVRHAPLGSDREKRKYWLLRRKPSDWMLAVELVPVPPLDPYPVSLLRPFLVFFSDFFCTHCPL